METRQKRKTGIEVSYRDIAKMLCRAMPVDGAEYGAKVESYLETIKAMSADAKLALRMAYVWSSKVPIEEREDFFQDVALALLEARIGDEKLAYAAARCDWKNWWAKYRIRQHMSLESVITADDGSTTEFGELLVGEAEFEVRLNGELDGISLYQQLPSWIKAIVTKRLIGKSITGGERHMLDKYVLSQPTILASYVK